MKKFLRIIAFIMALLTLSGMVAACAETGTTETTTDAGAAATEAPAVETTAEETLYDGKDAYADDIYEGVTPEIYG